MAAPTKNLLAPTTLSSIDITSKYSKPLFVNNNLKNLSGTSMAMLSSPLFFNQLGERFNFISPAFMDLTNSYTTPLFINSNIKTISQNSMTMLINTFPAVYTPAVLRPTYGQLFPLSSQIPY